MCKEEVQLDNFRILMRLSFYSTINFMYSFINVFLYISKEYNFEVGVCESNNIIVKLYIIN